MPRLVLIALAQQEHVEALAEQVKANDPEAAVFVTDDYPLDFTLVLMEQFEQLVKPAEEQG